MNRTRRTSLFVLLFTLIFILSSTMAVFAAQSIEYTTNGAANQYVSGSVLVLYGKVTDGGKAVPNTAVTVDIKDSNGKTIYYGQLKTSTTGYFKTTFTIPSGVSNSMIMSIKTSSAALDPVTYSLTNAASIALTGFVPAGYMAGDPATRISYETERLGLVFNANVNYFNNKNNNLDLESLGVNERNRDCVELYELNSLGNYVKISSTLDMVVSDADGGNQTVSGITYLSGVALDDQKNQRKDVLYVVPADDLKPGTKYKVVIDGDLSANNSATLGTDVTAYFWTNDLTTAGGGSTTTSGGITTTSGAVTFSDIEHHWAKSYIESMAAKGLVKGVNETDFAPDRSVTRAEFAVLLSRILKIENAGVQNNFSDVSETAWYNDGVAQAASAGIVLGDKGKFRPNDSISRQEMAVMLARAYSYAGGNAMSGSSVSYSDKAKIASWAYDQVAQIAKLNIMTGYPDGTFAPLKDTTRAEAVKTLKVFMDLMDL